MVERGTDPMSDDQDDAETEFERWNQVYEEYVRPRLERAEKAYNQALASLWLGNGAAALAALSAIGASWRQGQQFPSLLLWPLWVLCARPRINGSRSVCGISARSPLGSFDARRKRNFCA